MERPSRMLGEPGEHPLVDPRYVEPRGEARQSEPFQQTRTVLRHCESSVRVSALDVVARRLAERCGR